jgi:hypothetical protein
LRLGREGCESLSPKKLIGLKETSTTPVCIVFRKVQLDWLTPSGQFDISHPHAGVILLRQYCAIPGDLQLKNRVKLAH